MGTSRDDQKSPEEITLAAHGITFSNQKLHFSPDRRWLVVVNRQLVAEISRELSEGWIREIERTERVEIFHVSRKFNNVQLHMKTLFRLDAAAPFKFLWLPDSSGIVFIIKNPSILLDLKTKTKTDIPVDGSWAKGDWSTDIYFSYDAKLCVKSSEYDFPQIAALREKIEATLDEKTMDEEFKKVSTEPGVRNLMMEYHKTFVSMLMRIEEFCEAQKFHATSRLPEAIQEQMEECQDEYEYRIFTEKDEKTPDKDARAKKTAIEYLSTYLTEHREKTPAECVVETVKQHPDAITLGSKKIKELFESISNMHEQKQVNASASASVGLFAPSSAAADRKADTKEESHPFIDFLQNWITKNSGSAEKQQLVTQAEEMLKTAREYQRKSILEANVGKFASTLKQKGVEEIDKFLDKSKIQFRKKK